ncbi:hypothetical protein Mal64_25820 [Pseudobythopirellula maris]|uniref:Uncharacterized protein n=1 Tax=Pseudobythopirellula maris TaxID=2527991 RepID=A0A5C5ZPE6_9BACT|nr:hypothetical protein Mal64_25820 [Pseudobythopirellula maris]
MWHVEVDPGGMVLGCMQRDSGMPYACPKLQRAIAFRPYPKQNALTTFLIIQRKDGHSTPIKTNPHSHHVAFVPNLNRFAHVEILTS